MSLGIAFGAKCGQVGYAPETVAYLAGMSVQPSGARAALIDNLIRGLIVDGVWPYLEWLNLMKSHDAQAARVNLINPAQVASLVGSPALVTDSGMQSWTTSNYLNSGVNLSTATKYLQNDAHMGVWVDSNSLIDASNIGQASAAFQSQLRANNAAGTAMRGAVNTASTGYVTATFATNGFPATSVGHSVIQRNSGANAAASTPVYKNGVKASTVSVVTTNASDVRQNVNFSIGFGGNTSSGARLQAAHFGGLMPDATVTAFYNRLNTFLSSF